MKSETLFILTVTFVCLGGLLLLHLILGRFCKNMHERSRDCFTNFFCISRETDHTLPLYDDLSIHEESPFYQNPPSYEEAVKLMKDPTEKITIIQKQLMASFHSFVSSDEYKLKCPELHTRLKDIVIA